jgi:hypothetical protein
MEKDKIKMYSLPVCMFILNHLGSPELTYIPRKWGRLFDDIGNLLYMNTCMIFMISLSNHSLDFWIAMNHTSLAMI